MEHIVSLCKRRGFVFQNSEIYGGINGFWDYGPVGVTLKNNVKKFWWDSIVDHRRDVVGVDTTIIAHPETWRASGHVASFSDPMVDCRLCKGRYREDQIEKDDAGNYICPTKKCKGDFTEARAFNLMFRTFVGAQEENTCEAYLRPETCQSIFTQFKNVLTVSRQKVPFGIAQIGKSFRNEITPRNFTFRSREFEQMELEFFVKPEVGIQKEWYEYWKETRYQWYQDLGIKKDKLHLRDHEKDELAHYASACVDVEYDFPFGRSELEGIADRGNYDLNQHIKFSKKDLSFFNQEANEKYVPAVIEASAGCDRTVITVLCDAYDEDEIGGEKRVVMRFAPHIAPIQLAVLPLSKKLAEPSMKLESDLRKEFKTDYDDAGSIGKRYRRQDEIGTPFCVTYDFDSESDGKVTVRDRDTTKQDRIAITEIKNYTHENMQRKA